MVSIEQRVRQGVEANWEDKQALIDWILREIELLRSAMPAAAYLESIASLLEATCFQELDLPDGTTFDGPVFLRDAALRMRFAINEEAEPDERVSSAAARGGQQHP
jgi:hypothetical protein